MLDAISLEISITHIKSENKYYLNKFYSRPNNVLKIKHFKTYHSRKKSTIYRGY